MTKSELISRIFAKYQDINNQQEVNIKHIDQIIKFVIDTLIRSLSQGKRIEIRGFGGFSLHYCPQRIGHNPKNGEAVFIKAKHVPHFKPGKELRERVNNSTKK